MKREFQATFATSLAGFWRNACMTLPEQKECRELYDTFDVLQMWRGFFEPKYGALESITHHTNPDDPPDATAAFTLGAVEIEHTIIEPAQVMQAAAIHIKEGSGRGRRCVPISGLYTRDEIKRIMYDPRHPVPWETDRAYLETRHTTLVSAISKKIQKHLPGGLLIMGGEITGRLSEIHMIEAAFRHVSLLRASTKWTFVIHWRWNPHEFFSALFTEQTGLKIRRGTFAAC